ncbi:MAG: hypothetical protein ACI906_004457 [Candidatus Latescibacterota bacterium]|jgi:hypothetical protein
MSTLRPFLLIVFFTVVSGWLAQRIELVYNGPYIAGSGGAPGGQVFLAVPLGILAALGLLRRWLGEGERAVIYAALAVGVSATASGLMHRFLPGLITGFYGGFASPTGPYYKFLQTVPVWLVPGGPNSPAAVGAFEGGMAVPWHAWLVPLLAWSFFFAALFLTSFCLVAIFRRRWLETERLGFPLLEMPLALLRGGIFSNRLFYWGMLVPISLLGINGLNHYFPAVPEIALSLNFADFLLDEPWKAMAPFETPFYFEFSPLLVGVAFLAPVEVSFSTWIFFFVSRFQLLITALIGRSEFRSNFIPGHGSPWLDWPGHFPFFMPQARGGLFFLALFGLWTARRSLGEMFNPRRWQVWGFAAGFVLLWGWIVLMGVPLLIAALALLAFFLLALAFARLRVDGGLPVAGVPQIIGYLFFVALGTGPGLFTDSTYVAFGLLAVLGFTCIGVWPALQFEGLKLAEVTGVSARRMVLGMCLGLVVGLAAGYAFSLQTIYEHGLFALQEQGGARSEARIGRYYNYLFKDAGMTVGSTDWVRLSFHGVGAAFTAFLAVMRQHFLRWPFHPMGYIFGTGFGWLVWGSALVGWLCKWLTVRYGGAQTYRRIMPFFLGMIFGEVVMRLLWAGVALWQGEMGAGFRF